MRTALTDRTTGPRSGTASRQPAPAGAGPHDSSGHANVREIRTLLRRWGRETRQAIGVQFAKKTRKDARLAVQQFTPRSAECKVRLAALHVFFRYIATRDPAHLALCQRVIGIPLKRAPRPSVDYLEREEMEALFKSGSRSTPRGRRDYALLCFAYQTGTRVQEIVTVRACDLQLEPPPHVRIWGKGRKERVLPLWTQTAGLLRALLEERNIDPRSTSTVFVNMRGMPLSRWGVRYILAKRVSAAMAAGSTVGNKRVHPHSVRHTCAVHMLQAGADPNAIRDVLGHSSSATTWRYARINMDMKRKAIESCTPEASRPRSPIPAWRRDDDLLTQLEAIGRQDAYVARSTEEL